VSAGSPLRRVLLAWARQAPGMLGPKQLPDVDWHLDPVDRALAVLPMFSWLPADLIMINARPVWLLQGMVTVDQFPLATRSSWRESLLAGVAPAVIGTIDVASGETRFFVDPSADSLAVAWTSVVGPLIASAASIPAELRIQIPYRAEWLHAQLPVLEGPGWNAGQLPPQSGSSVPVWMNGRTPGRQVTLEQANRDAVSTIITAYRLSGQAQIRLDRRDPESTIGDGRGELRQQWGRAAALMHLKDSVTAAGDTIWARGLHRYVGPTASAWQAVFAVPRIGAPSLLWVSTALGDRVGGARTPVDAWKTVSRIRVHRTTHRCWNRLGARCSTRTRRSGAAT
jgi:hypothetical protein